MGRLPQIQPSRSWLLQIPNNNKHELPRRPFLLRSTLIVETCRTALRTGMYVCSFGLQFVNFRLFPFRNCLLNLPLHLRLVLPPILHRLRVILIHLRLALLRAPSRHLGRNPIEPIALLRYFGIALVPDGSDVMTQSLHSSIPERWESGPVGHGRERSQQWCVGRLSEELQEGILLRDPGLQSAGTKYSLFTRSRYLAMRTRATAIIPPVATAEVPMLMANANGTGLGEVSRLKVRNEASDELT